MCDHEAPTTEEADQTYLNVRVLASLVGILVFLAPAFLVLKKLGGEVKSIIIYTNASLFAQNSCHKGGLEVTW